MPLESSFDAWLYICIRFASRYTRCKRRFRYATFGPFGISLFIGFSSSSCSSRFSRRERKAKKSKEKAKEEAFFPVFHFHNQSFLIEERETEDVRLLLTTSRERPKEFPLSLIRTRSGLLPSRAVSAKRFMYQTW